MNTTNQYAMQNPFTQYPRPTFPEQSQTPPGLAQDAKDVIALIEAEGRKAIPLPGDISEEEFCRSLVESSNKVLGGLDILVNVAGKQTAVAEIAKLTTEQFDRTFRTNVYAMFWLCKAALPHMPAGATIINTTSIQSYQPSPMRLDYASTKAAITAFTHALAKQVVEKGTRVNGMAPGPVWTPLQSCWPRRNRASLPVRSTG